MLVAHHVPVAAEPLGGPRVLQRRGHGTTQRRGLVLRHEGVGAHGIDGAHDLLLRRGVLDRLVHQYAQAAGRQLAARPVLRVSLCGQPQPEVGNGGRIAVEHRVEHAAAFARRRLRHRTCGAAPLRDPQAVVARRRTHPALLRGARAVRPGQGLAHEGPRMAAVARLHRHVDVERLLGTGKGHVEQVDVVHMGVDQLAVVGRGEVRLGHVLAVAHRKAAEGPRACVVRLAPHHGATARLGVERPRAIGNDHDLVLESLGLVHGHDAHRGFAPLDAERLTAARLVPPFEEERQVGRAAGAAADHRLVERLEVGRLLAPGLQAVAHDDALERLGGRQQAHRTAEVALPVGQRRIERTCEVVVVHRTVHAVARVERQAHDGGQEGAHGGLARHERLLRHDVEAVAGVAVPPLEVEQPLGDAHPLGVRAHEDQDVAGPESAVEHLADAFDHGRLVGVVGHAHVARAVRMPRGTLLVAAVGVGQRVAERAAEAGVEAAPVRRAGQLGVEPRVVRGHGTADDPVVEVHHGPEAAVVVAQTHRLGGVGAQRAPRAGVEDTPVASAPAVDRLLDVAHEQHALRLGLRHGILQQRQEVAPLAGRSVLEFVDHEALEAVAGLLVDERRVVVADQLGEDVFGLGQQHDVLLAAQLTHLGVEVGQQREAAVVLAQQRRGVPGPDVTVIEVAHALQQGLQLRTHALRGAPGLAPRPLLRTGVAHAAAVGLRGARGDAVEVGGEPRALVGEIRRREPRAGDGLHGLRGRAPQLVARRPRAAQRHAVLLLEQFAAEREDALADVPPAPLLDALLHELHEPPAQLAVGGDPPHEGVGAAVHDGLGFDLGVVVGGDAQLADESPQDALEELVDGEHREVRIVVQDVRPHVPRPAAHRVGREPQVVAQLPEVGARGSGGQFVDAFENARLHLLGSLVGEGYGEDAAVARGIVDHVAHVLVGQPVGLARAGARIQNLRSHGIVVKKRLKIGINSE